MLLLLNLKSEIVLHPAGAHFSSFGSERKSDTTVARSGMGTMLKIWDPNTGVVLYNFVLPVDDPQHGESPLKLALNQNLLVTYGGRFSDASDVAVRNVLSPINIRLRGVLGYSTTGGREVEVDQNFLICANTWSNQHASSIDIWSVSTLEILRRIEQPSNVIKDLKVIVMSI